MRKGGQGRLPQFFCRLGMRLSEWIGRKRWRGEDLWSNYLILWQVCGLWVSRGFLLELGAVSLICSGSVCRKHRLVLETRKLG